MPDLPIVIPDTAAAPKDYTLSGTQELALKTVRALIDGSGAASAFLPTLQLLDPNGHVMWEGATSDTVAAGGSADVSWFPGLGGGLGSGTTNAEWVTVSRTTSQTMLAGANDTVIWTAATLQSSDSTLFSLGTQNHPDDAIVMSRAGVLFYMATALPGALEPNFTLGMDVQRVNGWGNNGKQPDNEFGTLSLAGGDTFGARDYGIGIPRAVPWQVCAFYKNFDAANRTLSQAQFAGIFWPTGVLHP